MSMDVDHTALLAALVERGASDLLCKAGSAPAFRIGGALVRDDVDPALGSPLTADEVAVLAQELLTPEQQQALLRDGSVVAAHSSPGVGNSSRVRLRSSTPSASVASRNTKPSPLLAKLNGTPSSSAYWMAWAMPAPTACWLSLASTTARGMLALKNSA